MSAESSLRAVLLAAPAVSALVGTRVYPMNLPQAPTLPAIAFQRISAVPDQLLGVESWRVPIRVSLSLWATTYDGVRALTVAVEAALRGYSGNGLRLVRLLNMTDDYEPETKQFRVIADYRVIPSEGVSA
jgi:hypothetical protein